MPQVSVVIPVYRGGPFVRDAVRSAVTQSLDDLEVLVVSDGCTEDLTDLERMDRRVQVLNRDHAGVSIARNSGVAASLGEYVAFLDEDDRCRSDRLQSQHDALRDSPSAGMCHGGFQVMNVDGVVEGPRLGKDLDYPAMLACQFPLLSSIMVRRSVFWEVGGFDPALVTGEDVDFALRIAMQSEVVYLPEVLTYYRAHDSNTTNTIAGIWDTYPVIQRHRRWAEPPDDPISCRPRTLGCMRFGIMHRTSPFTTRGTPAARETYRRRPDRWRSASCVIRVWPPLRSGVQRSAPRAPRPSTG